MKSEAFSFLLPIVLIRYKGLQSKYSRSRNNIASIYVTVHIVCPKWIYHFVQALYNNFKLLKHTALGLCDWVLNPAITYKESFWSEY